MKFDLDIRLSQEHQTRTRMKKNFPATLYHQTRY